MIQPDRITIGYFTAVGRCLALLTVLGAAVHNAGAVDGIAMSYHSNATNVSGLHAGTMIRHIIRSDTVDSDTALYGQENVRQVRLSTDGTRAAFIRNRDGMLCVMGIDGGTVRELVDISPDASVDWSDSVWIYYTYLYNHVTIRRINIHTLETKDIGYLAYGIVTMEISAMRDTVTGYEDTQTEDSIRGCVVIDAGGGEYLSTTIFYRAFQKLTFNECAGHISPSGAYFAIGACENDTAAYHRRLRIYTWDGDSAGEISAPPGECITRGCWAVNSDEWLAVTAGRDRELLWYHDMAILSRDSSAVIRVTRNDTGGYDEACDFWVGNPDSAIAASAVYTAIRQVRQKYVSPLRHDDDRTAFGEKAVCVYSLRGERLRMSPEDGDVPAGVYVLGKQNRTILRYEARAGRHP